MIILQQKVEPYEKKNLSRINRFSFAITLVLLRLHSFTLKLSVNQLSADRPNGNHLAGTSTQSQSLTLLQLVLLVLGLEATDNERKRQMTNEKVARLLFNQVFLENDFVLEI